ncbi:DUF1080 domain-containing protein [Spirosoma sp. KNUC1025]|uniref:3-keto-disaccharide hydrolase n=1 Tax=Spirosoma sp. KNUC1025 TaxID=2894082 RepID=UPI001E629991|nr:DUF1080 domain-containing protein [Spirosoma sp. KNUC1025]UFH57801.1 DUF1080 domain-containing protein [Spirosoma sp. KNUC1025]
MKLIPTLWTCLSIFLTLQATAQSRDWTPLLDKNLTQWETYLSYAHKVGYNGKIPTDAAGSPVQPIGYNKDETGVFSVIREGSGPVLRISGTTYGCLFPRQTYENYHLTLQVKWGKQKHDPRKNQLRDSGILYHSIGPAGAEYWRSWMLSQEFQVMEGHMGDFWCQANSAIDIRSFQSEGIMNRVADEKQPYGTFKKGQDSYCMRSANYESPMGEWTTLELICFEGKSLHIVNGHVVMVLKDSRYTTADGGEVAMRRGKIQLQSEAAEVFYRDIRIKPLTTLPQGYAGLFNE